MKTCRILILPHGVTRTVPKNTLLADVIRDFLAENRENGQNTHLEMACAGRGTCGKCGVKADGESRLACQTRVTADMTVELAGAGPSAGDENSAHILTWVAPGMVDFRSKILQPVAAADLGTTTLALSLLKNGETLHTAACENPLRRFGLDVISRIQYASSHENGTAEMQAVLRAALSEMLAEACEKTGVPPAEIAHTALAGNTVMEQIYMGLDITPLGQFPFTPASDFRTETGVYVFPPISGFVGGDITAGIAASGLLQQKSPVLFLDIGTNGELVLFTPEKTLACATAAGPAFEGAQITHGMTARPGAVERVKLSENGEIIELRTISDAPPVGICGSGLVDLTAELLRCGLLTPDGKLHTPDGRFYLTESENPDEKLFLTQQDIRQVQLATGAISTGIRILLRRLGLAPGELSALWLAGAFGRHLRMENVQRIGMIPQEISPEKVHFLGNTALLGAQMAALSPDFMREASQIPANVEAVDLSLDAHFSEYFMESMMFPEGE